MKEKEFWNLIEKNKKYIPSRMFNGHNFLINISYETSLLNKKESSHFFSILYSKFNSMFTKNHIEIFTLYNLKDYISLEKNKLMFVFDNSKVLKTGIYNKILFLNFIRFRYNIILDGEHSYIEYLSNPYSIMKYSELQEEIVIDSIFRIKEYSLKQKDLGMRNYGTFEKELDEIEDFEKYLIDGGSSITYGNYEENYSNLLKKLYDFSKLHWNENPLNLLNNFHLKFIKMLEIE